MPESEFDPNEYVAQAMSSALASALDAKAIGSVLSALSAISDIRRIQSDTQIPQEQKDAVSALIAFDAALGLGWPTDIPATYEGFYDAINNAPERLGGGTKDDFFRRLNEMNEDLFPLDPNGGIGGWGAGPTAATPKASVDNTQVKPPDRPVPQVLDNAKTEFVATNNKQSPLVLDIDGDGIELTDVEGSDSVYWDIDADGFAETSAWVTGGDGLLVVDLNSDGIINDHSELFGDQTGYLDGFAALEAYDSNSDGFITSADAGFGDLLVWIDANGDGFSAEAELFTLTELDISSINLGASSVNYAINGNDVKLESTFTIDGQTRAIVDAWFAFDNFNTIYMEDYSISAGALACPNLRGYGDIPELAFALSGDATLLSMVQELAEASAGELMETSFDLQGKVVDILYRWADVDGVDPESRGDYIDARALEFMERYFGSDFYQEPISSPNPGNLVADDLEEIFEQIVDDAIVSIVAQSNGFFFVSYEGLYDTFSGHVEGEDVIRNFLFNEASTSNTLEGSEINDGYIWSIGDGDDSFTDTGGLDKVVFADDIAADGVWFEAYGQHLKIHKGSETITIVDQYYDYVYGASTHRSIEKAVFADGSVVDLLNDVKFQGTSGNDSIDTYVSDDILVGLAGNDTLSGGDGDDKYVWSIGDGDDSISETAGVDELVLGAGITAEDIRLERYGATSLDVYIGSERIRINNQLYDLVNSANTGYEVETLRFTNDTTLDLVNNLTLAGTSSGDWIEGLEDDNTLIGAGGNDSLYGYGGNDTLYGDADNDQLFGGDADDVLYGGSGSDVLNGGAGADTFVFEAASAFSSADTVADFSTAQSDKIDIADLLDGYVPGTSDINDFVIFTTVGSDSELAIDRDGSGTTHSAVTVASIAGVTGLDPDTLLGSGLLIAA